MDAGRYQRRWLKYLDGYEKRARTIVRKAFRDAVLNIDFSSLTPATYPASITAGIVLSDISSGFVDLYFSIGVVHGRRVGRGINADLKNFLPGFFDQEFRRELGNWLIKNNVDSQIITVRSNLIQHLIEFIALRLERGAQMQTIISDIQKYVLGRSFYDWQIERIVRTEVISAANYGASIAAGSAGTKMKKVWISARDPRTRRISKGDSFDHWEMHLKESPANEPFGVPTRGGGTENMQFPGDPKGSAGNRINCRCTVAYVPVRDAMGNLIFTRPERDRPKPGLQL